MDLHTTSFNASTPITAENEIEAIWYVLLKGPVLLPRSTRFTNGTLAGVYSILIQRGVFSRTHEPARGRFEAAYRLSFTALGRTMQANLREDSDMDAVYQAFIKERADYIAKAEANR